MLEYLALGILVFVFITLFYGVIIVHDIPYEIAVHRNHPHQDAIHVAGWISLFTLNVIWPFLWIWATLYREDRGWGMTNKQAESGAELPQPTQLTSLEERIEALEKLCKGESK
ncbi:MAG: hypothetical protein COA99_10550 [Moraxellaceae bacterium]|nr:MAG: hypothetical protein COA99_10550 [Moraxellaceae bacterium]